MNAIQMLSAQPWVTRLGWTLIHFLWQGALIAALYAMARRSQSARARYLLACVALAVMTATPFVTFSLTGASDSPPINPFTAAVPRSPASVSLAYALPASLPISTIRTWRDDAMPWLVITWFAGALVFWARLAGGWIVATRMRSTLVRAAPLEWQRTLDKIKTRIGISSPVALLVSALAQVPTVIGWLRPVVLVPVGVLAGLPPEHVEALLAHELAHIRRRDYLVNILQNVTEALLFYHPAVWWISSHIRKERELCCDDIAVSICSDALTYVHALANLESQRAEHLNLVLAADGGSLRDRIARLLGTPRNTSLSLPGTAIIAGAVAILATAFAVFGQSAPAPLAFDVASIKPNNSGDNHLQVRVAPGGRLTAANAPLRLLITAAYQVQDFELSGGPAWLDSARFDIEARGPGNPTGDQVMQMLQTLLADRFGLRMHKETRELPVYALLIAKNGPRLEPPRDDCFDPTAGVPPPASDARPCGGFANSPNQMLGARVTMGRLAAALSRRLRRPVVDKTGLGGVYNITLEWTPDETQPSPAPTDPSPPAADNSGSIFTALQEQLGLRLESQKGPVEILVIDHAERPSEN